MARLKNPLMSMTAQKQLGKSLIYKMKGNRAFVTGYSRPGRKNPFSPSASQVTNREFYSLAVATWQEQTQNEKNYWDNLSKTKNLNMSGWNLFYQKMFAGEITILKSSFYGVRIYGNFNYGKQ